MRKYDELKWTHHRPLQPEKHSRVAGEVFGVFLGLFAWGLLATAVMLVLRVLKWVWLS